MSGVIALVLLALTLAVGSRAWAQGPVPGVLVDLDGTVHIPVGADWSQQPSSELLTRAKGVYKALRARGVTAKRMIIVVAVTGQQISTYAESEMSAP